MPFGSTAFGVTAFSALKLAGYSVAGLYLNRAEGTPRPHPLAFGLARTAFGIAVGYGVTLTRVSITNQAIPFYAGLIPVRVLEWLLILWLFYRSVPDFAERRNRYVVLGVGWSFVLDLPAAVAAFSVPGGFWVC